VNGDGISGRPAQFQASFVGDRPGAKCACDGAVALRSRSCFAIFRLQFFSSNPSNGRGLVCRLAMNFESAIALVFGAKRVTSRSAPSDSEVEMLFAKYTHRQSLPLNTVTMVVVQARGCRAAQWTARWRAARTAAQGCGEIHGQ